MTDHLKCGGCDLFPVPVFRKPNQQACNDGHFLCSNCNACKCGCPTITISNADYNLSKTSPYFNKALVHGCTRCDFASLEKHRVHAHELFSCDRGYEMSEKRQRRAPYHSTTNTILINDPRFPLDVQLKDAMIHIGNVFVTIESMQIPIYLVIESIERIFFTETIGQEILHRLPQKSPLRITVFPIFIPPPVDALQLNKDSVDCSFVPRYLRRLHTDIQSRAMTALQNHTPFQPVAPVPAHVRLSEHTSLFEDACHVLFGEEFKGGLLFYVPPGELEEGPTNGFYFFLVEIDNTPLIICPGCLQPFQFDGHQSCFYKHLNIVPDLIIESAARVTPELFYSQHMPPCIKFAHAADFRHESYPTQTRRDLQLRKHKDLYAYKLTIAGRSRHIGIYIENRRLHCMRCRQDITESPDGHFALDPRLIASFGKVEYGWHTTSINYSQSLGSFIPQYSNFHVQEDLTHEYASDVEEADENVYTFEEKECEAILQDD